MSFLWKKGFRFSPFQFIILGFLCVIFVGTFLLMLPFSTVNREGASFLTALFTATSATCVTGLVVQDTATYWSTAGHVILMILIQIGGVGVVTLFVSITQISHKKIDLIQRSTMQEAIAAPNLGGIVRLTGFILKTTFFVELAGAILMVPVFVKDFGIKGIWYAIFHSVSAFCNAGFDLMGEKERFSSLTAYSANATISITIMLLIMIGGIGFVTWDDIRVHKHHISRYRLQSKVTLLMTGVLIVLPTLYFYFVEFTRPVWQELSSTERLLDAFFMAVTPRTAGFNTVNLNQISEPGSAITIILMLIGGSPGSTAGGMKTTTVFVLLVTSYTIFRRKEDTNCFGRRMMEDTIRNAATIMMMYLFLFLIGGILIGCIEDVPILNALFETASAIGTVGLTLGITPSLGVASRWILIVLMFLGRVGGLTLIYATIARKKSSFSRLPQEKITVG